jgi:hypothetical protein
MCRTHETGNSASTIHVSSEMDVRGAAHYFTKVVPQEIRTDERLGRNYRVLSVPLRYQKCFRIRCLNSVLGSVLQARQAGIVSFVFFWS